MTLSLKHRFVVLLPDEATPSVVRPSNWNDDHNLNGTSDKLLGFDGGGAAAEITVGAGLTLASNTLSAAGGGGAPANAPYITSTADATLTNERVLTNTPTITWDFGTVGQAKANAVATPRVQRLVTTSPITVAAGDDIITCNVASGSPTCTLPLASTRAGKPVTFKDVGGQFAAHNLTITPTGPDTIEGLASIVLSNNYAAVTLVPANDGTTTGWFIL